jgi:3-carboxy-cis,cis-muconate cycloisomerase
MSVEGLVVDSERMRANLDLAGSLIMAESLTMALARSLGRTTAFRLVETASERAKETNRSLRDIASSDNRIASVLSLTEIDEALDPTAYLGSSSHFIDRALAEHHDALSMARGA